jgi:hypothetical protein
MASYMRLDSEVPQALFRPGRDLFDYHFPTWAPPSTCNTSPVTLRANRSPHRRNGNWKIAPRRADASAIRARITSPWIGAGNGTGETGTGEPGDVPPVGIEILQPIRGTHPQIFVIGMHCSS